MLCHETGLGQGVCAAPVKAQLLQRRRALLGQHAAPPHDALQGVGRQGGQAGVEAGQQACWGGGGASKPRSCLEAV